MRFENCNGVKGLNGSNHSEPKTVLTGRMPYVIVRESAVNWWTTVQGLNHYEVGRGAKSYVTRKPNLKQRPLVKVGGDDFICLQDKELWIRD